MSVTVPGKGQHEGKASVGSITPNAGGIFDVWSIYDCNAGGSGRLGHNEGSNTGGCSTAVCNCR